MTETEAAATNEDPQDVRDQANRVWAHAMHEDNEFAQHANFFLIAEYLLVVAYSAILASKPSTGDQRAIFLAADVIAAFGLLLTLVWGYACHHQGLQVNRVRERAIELLPEYRAAGQARNVA